MISINCSVAVQILFVPLLTTVVPTAIKMLKKDNKSEYVPVVYKSMSGGSLDFLPTSRDRSLFYAVRVKYLLGKRWELYCVSF